MTLVIEGRVVPLDAGDPSAAFHGRVFVSEDGIEAVTKGNGAAPVGFANAPTVDVGDNIVMPGLIDLHNHLGYNTLPLWSEPSQVEPFRHHKDWTDTPTYKPKVTWPAWIVAKAEPAALLAYVQARALVGGTTAIQGWPAANRKVGQALRNVDDESLGTSNENLIYTAVVTKNQLELSKMAQKVNNGIGFIYHCAEGRRDSVVRDEFIDAASAGCLKRTFVGIHCNAISPADWQLWGANEAGGVAWSPFSNLWLYGETTDVPAAQAHKVKVCLGSDWGPSGTKNVLGEVKVARLTSDKLGFGITDEELVTMITANPGDLLARCWKRPVGRLVPDGFADITVLRPKGDGSVWSQIVRATEKNVLLTVVGGRPCYGDVPLMTAAGAQGGSTVTVAGKKKKLVLPDPDQPEPDPDQPVRTLRWDVVRRRLNAVKNDPGGAVARGKRRNSAWAGAIDALGAPLELALDMPGGGGLAFAGPPPHPAEVEIPRLPSLVHDAAFFKAVHGNRFHGGVLDGLAQYYR